MQIRVLFDAHGRESVGRGPGSDLDECYRYDQGSLLSRVRASAAPVGGRQDFEPSTGMGPACCRRRIQGWGTGSSDLSRECWLRLEKIVGRAASAIRRKLGILLRPRTSRETGESTNGPAVPTQ